MWKPDTAAGVYRVSAWYVINLKLYLFGSLTLYDARVSTVIMITGRLVCDTPDTYWNTHHTHNHTHTHTTHAHTLHTPHTHTHYTRTHTHTRHARARTHTHAHTCTHAHTHTIHRSKRERASSWILTKEKFLAIISLWICSLSQLDLARISLWIRILLQCIWLEYYFGYKT